MKGVQSISMNSAFRSSLVQFLCRPIEPWSGAQNGSEARVRIDAQAILDNLSRHWERLLYFLVGVGSATVSDTARNFLLKTELMSERGRGAPSITAKGYEYLLQDQAEQAWTFIREVLEMNKADRHREEIVSLVCSLSYCVQGQGYLTAAVTDVQRRLVVELTKLGLVYIDEKYPQLFFPTQLVISLLYYRSISAAPSDSKLMSERHISVIVETNFQVVAYVTSELYLAILRIFVDVTLRLPNAVLGQITRAKSKEAFNRGITSEQIRHFLTAHAHPRVRGKAQVIPPNVNAQILLWEREKERVSGADAVLLDLSRDGQAGRSRFAVTHKVAVELDACLWADEKSACIVIAASAVDAVESLVLSRGALT